MERIDNIQQPLKAKKILTGTATSRELFPIAPGCNGVSFTLFVQPKVFRLLFEPKKAVHIMKKKILLPVLALVLALASAFAPMPPNQMGWYKDTSVFPPTVQQGTITTPSDTDVQPCALGRTNVCKVGIYNAHSTSAGATDDTEITLLKYNN
jgi:hypothetical protein